MKDIFTSTIIRQDMENLAARMDYEVLRGKKFLITGAAGMVVSYTIFFLIWLNEKHHFGIEIYACVRNPEKALRRYGIYARKKYFHVYVHDVNMPIDLDVEVDYVYHAAGLASPQYYGSSPVETILPNVIGTNEVLKFCARRKIESYLFFSTGSVYGEVHGEGSYNEKTVGYLDHTAPGAVYGESKRCGEALSLAYYREYGVPVKAVRIFHTYGPTLDLGNDHRAFSEFTKNIVCGENIILKSDGREKRPFCYIVDATLALFKILTHGINGECYNLANEKEFVCIRDLAEQLTALFPEKNLKVVYKKREDSGYVPLSQTSSIPCSTEKLRNLGYDPIYSIKDGFERTIRYFIEESDEE